MTLKNKDGSIYRLSGPNPVMKEQKTWGSFITHNLNWNPENKPDTDKKVELIEKQEDSFLEELEKTKTDIKIVETKKEADPQQNLIEKVFIHCLPASIRERKDSLYGDSYKTIQYSDPISFEGVIISQSDLSVQIWTDTNKIEEGSILYPKTMFKRWWRVQNKEAKAGGWLLTAMPSDYQPSFS